MHIDFVFSIFQLWPSTRCRPWHVCLGRHRRWIVLRQGNCIWALHRGDFTFGLIPRLREDPGQGRNQNAKRAEKGEPKGDRLGGLRSGAPENTGIADRCVPIASQIIKRLHSGRQFPTCRLFQADSRTAPELSERPQLGVRRAIRAFLI